jgi:hypothetical protein
MLLRGDERHEGKDERLEGKKHGIIGFYGIDFNCTAGLRMRGKR